MPQWRGGLWLGSLDLTPASSTSTLMLWVGRLKFLSFRPVVSKLEETPSVLCREGLGLDQRGRLFGMEQHTGPL